MKNGQEWIGKFFLGLSNKFKAHCDLISSRLDYHGEQGKSNENLLLDFLEKYLPERFSVGSGKSFSL